MYRCQNCNTVVPANNKLNRVVVETRERSYPIIRTSQKGRRGEPMREQVGTATGSEIVKELDVCVTCAREIAEPSPVQAAVA